MVWIILCAISYIGIFVMFKIIDVKKAPLINCIVVNYLTAAVLGFCVFGSLPVVSIVKASWFPMGILLGFLFIVTFLLVGISSSKTGIVITTVASKMSLVIPMLFSIIAYNETVSVVKVVAIALAVASVFLCTYKPSGSKAKEVSVAGNNLRCNGCKRFASNIFTGKIWHLRRCRTFHGHAICNISSLWNNLFNRKGRHFKELLEIQSLVIWNITWLVQFRLGIFCYTVDEYRTDYNFFIIWHLQHINHTAVHSHRRNVLQGKTNQVEYYRWCVCLGNYCADGVCGNVKKNGSLLNCHYLCQTKILFWEVG